MDAILKAARQIVRDAAKIDKLEYGSNSLFSDNNGKTNHRGFRELTNRIVRERIEKSLSLEPDSLADKACKKQISKVVSETIVRISSLEMKHHYATICIPRKAPEMTYPEENQKTRSLIRKVIRTASVV